MNSDQETNVNDLPSDVMMYILMKVEAENPLPLRCVSKWWESLVVHPYFMQKNITASTASIFSYMNAALDRFTDFKLQYITYNVAMRHENGPDDEEIRRVMKAFDEAERVWKNVEKLCAEVMIGNEGDVRIALMNCMLVLVRHLKENFINMRDNMQDLEDRIICYQNCCRIHDKSLASSSASY